MSDINTLVSYTPEKGEEFSLNQVIRTLDTIANDVYKNFDHELHRESPEQREWPGIA